MTGDVHWNGDGGRNKAASGAESAVLSVTAGTAGVGALLGTSDSGDPLSARPHTSDDAIDEVSIAGEGRADALGVGCAGASVAGVASWGCMAVVGGR